MRSTILALLLALFAPSAHADPVEESAPPEAEGTDDAPALDAESPASDEGEAEPEEPTEGRRRRPLRWSDGPRRVPVPRGASRERAVRLGLGTRECASRLLHHAPDAEWTAAVRGRSPTRLLWPVDDGGWVRGFGYVRRTRPDLLHRGIDIAAPEGTTVRAAADGIVAYADNGVRGYGNLVMIVHANGWMTLYAHNSRITVQPGYRVTRGERIALVGQTGIAHGPHVHFELWEHGRAIDPAALMDGGPTFVDRLAARAAARGDVPPPEEVTDADRPIEPALAPWVEGEIPPPLVREAPVLEVGSRALFDHLLEHPLPATIVPAGRTFSSLLLPVRAGRVSRAYRSSRAPMEVDGEDGAAVRAAADGTVVFAGEVPERGAVIVLAHPNGWVTIYERVGDVAVHAGDAVERGSWIGRLGARALRFGLRVGGVSRDPDELLVGVD